MIQVRFTDDITFTVETTHGIAHIIVRDLNGLILQEYEFTPVEAYRIGEALNAAAFAASGQEKNTPPHPPIESE